MPPAALKTLAWWDVDASAKLELDLLYSSCEEGRIEASAIVSANCKDEIGRGIAAYFASISRVGRVRDNVYQSRFVVCGVRYGCWEGVGGVAVVFFSVVVAALI